MKRINKIYIHIISIIIISIVLLFYMLIPFYSISFNYDKGFFISYGIHKKVLIYAGILYIIYQAVVIQTSQKNTKLENLLKGIINNKITIEDKKNIRYIAVKIFFIPLMLPSAILYFNLLIDLMYSGFVYKNFIHFFNNTIFSFIIYIVSFVTLSYYSFGYLIDSKKLNSEIKSVDNSILGWSVLLICYVPFFTFTTQYIPFPTQDYAYFINDNITFVIRIFLSFIMLFKLYVVTNLGAKCSNLTNRGIVTTGAYKHIRHPHYLSKLIVWWVTFMPYFINNIWAIGPMIFWTVIYFLRAITEEQHLSKDKEYIRYKNKVKWMFIPYVI